jgi:hypothetical protein
LIAVFSFEEWLLEVIGTSQVPVTCLERG